MSEQLSLSWNILMEAFTFYFIKLSHLLEYSSIFKHYLKKHTILCKIVMATTVAEINCSKCPQMFKDQVIFSHIC